MRDHTISYLVKRLMEEGVINAETVAGGKTILHYWIKTNKITLRRRPWSGWYVVNQKEVDKIVKDFTSK